MHNKNQLENMTSCDPAITRKDFLSKVIKGAALTGGLLVAPKVLDKFLIQPVYASASTCTQGPGAGNTDTGGATCTDNFETAAPYNNYSIVATHPNGLPTDTSGCTVIIPQDAGGITPGC